MTAASPPSLTYDVVIATRNRPDVLSFSLPSILTQSIPPERLIVVDASNDHAQTVNAAESCCSSHANTTDLQIIYTKPWQTAQRNEGLRHVRSPIVFIPDDDSILLPSAAEAILQIYQRDTEERIGGVGMKEIHTPPPSVRSEDAARARDAGIVDRIIARFGPMKARLLNRLAEGPMHVACRIAMEHHTPPNWLSEVDASPAPFLHGFRMTFRTDIVRRCGFNEDFARGRGYDDFDISLAVLQTHLLVNAERAEVYHHRVGGKRDDGLEAGITQLLNPCYITCRHTSPESPARRAVLPFARRLTIDYALRALSRYDRDRLRGIRRARKWLHSLLTASPEVLTERYQHAFNESRAGNNPAPTITPKESIS